ncbi:beta-mannosidase (plasmid) [Fulvitalea axinellae]|uniref:Beta-mannosidase B n=1 Tax=Fulvitalea axinellae TaxID=1182444 RepID=A0AAU9CL69_9BACT|nr:beta-mannosidase [Fulvitalea axinellae]
MMKRWFYWLVALTAWACQPNKGFDQQALEGDWKFRQADKNEWMSATVPGTVHTDLLANKKISDPFYRTNEKDQQWIETKDWEYSVVFDTPEGVLDRDVVALEFPGLDTYADVFLNDSLILKSDNMFVGYEVPCKGALKAKDNELRVVFRSPVNEVMDEWEASPYRYPADNDQHEKKLSVFTRKAPYHYGWDWGPRFVTSGIYRPVALKSWNSADIKWVQYTQKSLTDDKAELVVSAEVEALTPGSYTFSVNGKDGEATFSNSKSFELKKGANKISLPLEVMKPKRWWPSGLGEANLYDMTASLQKGNSIVSEKSERFGFRTIEVVNKPDDMGTSFFFKVNGEPVFMKGANYIPSDNFVTEVDSARYRYLLESAKDANMNMIRVWGGGIYENDYFYELADEMGLLVWQDFMFACTMYPGSDDFLRRVEEEAVYNVKRLRNHPSIALWCGNNEIQGAWESWGWQKSYGYSEQDSINLYNDYKAVFHELLPKVTSELDDKFYLASSPLHNWPKAEDRANGDNHYWGVWWGKLPFESYKKYIARFMSEYGFQSFPEMESIKKYSVPEDWAIESDVMKAHQRSSIGNKTIKLYMDMYYDEPKDFESFVYVGQVLQAEGLKIGFEAHRRAMPFCMGSLYWQLNDCWPVASWSGIDYYGNWKATHYYIKKAFEPVLVSPDMDSTGVIKVFAVSDKLEPVKAKLNISLIDNKGKVLQNRETEISVKPNGSNVYWETTRKAFLKGDSGKETFMYVTLKSEDGSVDSENFLFFEHPKDVKLAKPTVKADVKKATDGCVITLDTDVLARNVYLAVPNEDGFFSDNYFNIIPGHTREIHLRTKLEPEVVRKKLKITTLDQAF